MQSYKNLFLRQSYLDSYDEYKKSLKKAEYPVWDYVIITASNEMQAAAYEQQIDFRLAKGYLPKNTRYKVIPDPEGKRVGSGGATLNVLRYIAEENGTATFSGLKILCIHSGGDSKRVPQYSACGKLFSPVPRELENGRRSTLFDEFIIAMTGVPARIKDGMLTASGDVLLLFNPLQLDFFSKGAAALSIKEDVESGKNHGVFLAGENGNVAQFLHKQPIETLQQSGATDANGNIDIDAGACIFSSEILEDLYSLIDTDEKFNTFVNEKARLSFYADFLYPMAEKATEEQFYMETPEGDYTEELRNCRAAIWALLHKYSIKLLRFSPASFIHFGTTKELLKLITDDMPGYRFLDWESYVNTNAPGADFAASNSYISKNDVQIGKGSYIEDSNIHAGTRIGKNCVISCVTLKGQTIPDNTVLHGLKLQDGRFVVRMYGVEDNPKLSSWRGEKLDEPLWSAKLFKACDTVEKAVDATLSGEKSGELFSLEGSFNNADVTAILPWQAKLDDKVKAERFLDAVRERKCVTETGEIFKNGISARIRNRLLKIAETEEFSTKIRIYYYLSALYSGEERENLADMCFKTIRDATLKSVIGNMKYNSSLKIAKDEVVTRLPVRVNFGGGWSDTPPYCIENGGTVLNAAITLDGNLPIEVKLKKLKEEKIVFESADNASYGEFDKLSALQDLGNPHDPFALHKAAIAACGIIPVSGSDETLQGILKHLGGGIYLSTRVINIPRGSGLGTSSILAGACVKGIYEFLGIPVTDNEIYNRVLCLEQLMSTGGGWQDQVGGLAPGVKMVSAPPGMHQNIQCAALNIPEAAMQELENRFCIIYTGQRRLARNLLREVVGKYIGADPNALSVLYEIQRVAVLMRFELERGNVNGFAELLSAHWELSQKLDKGCTNTCIDQIFNSIEDLISGKMICGAGGGGFLQVILKPEVTVAQLKKRLSDVFADSGVDVWTCEFQR